MKNLLILSVLIPFWLGCYVESEQLDLVSNEPNVTIICKYDLDKQIVTRDTTECYWSDRGLEVLEFVDDDKNLSTITTLPDTSYIINTYKFGKLKSSSLSISEIRFQIEHLVE